MQKCARTLHRTRRTLKGGRKARPGVLGVPGSEALELSTNHIFESRIAAHIGCQHGSKYAATVCCARDALQEILDTTQHLVLVSHKREMIIPCKLDQLCAWDVTCKVPGVINVQTLIARSITSVGTRKN